MTMLKIIVRNKINELSGKINDINKDIEEAQDKILYLKMLDHFNLGGEANLKVEISNVQMEINNLFRDKKLLFAIYDKFMSIEQGYTSFDYEKYEKEWIENIQSFDV